MLSLRELSAPAQICVAIIAGWMWVSTFFYTRTDAEAAHDSMERLIERGNLNFEIGKVNAEMDFIEQDGVDANELRDYKLLEFQLEHHTKRLLVLGK